MPDEKCPWCGAEAIKRRLMLSPWWVCGTARVEKPPSTKRSPQCRIGELEAKLAGALAVITSLEPLRAACREFGKADIEMDAGHGAAASTEYGLPRETVVLKHAMLEAAVRGLCRQLAEKGDPDGDAN